MWYRGDKVCDKVYIYYTLYFIVCMYHVVCDKV